ncbi:MAG: septum formation initiator family protein [Verrucomicrobiota bacterium]
MKYQEIQNESPTAPQPVDRMLGGLVRLGKICLLLLVVPVVVEIYKKPLAEQNAQREKLEALKTQRDALAGTRDKLVRQMDWIKNDKDHDYLEMRARDHEHMHKKGEYVIRFE